MLPNKFGAKSGIKIKAGKPWPLGSSITPKGVNFSVAAPDATGMQLILFAKENDPKEHAIINLNEENKSGNYWHVEVEGIGEGTLYGFRIPNTSNTKERNISNKILLDPCTRLIAGWESYKREPSNSDFENIDSCLKGVVCERNKFDFTSHPRPRHSWEDTVIYELHVGAFTKNFKPKDSNIKQGTFIGLKEKIGYLKDLGVTTIELLPIFAFDPTDAPKGQKNFWGYSPINWFSPHKEYLSSNDPLKAREEIRGLVATCHDQNIEVLLDVVYNHTTEGNIDGPTISWKGFGDCVYYHKNKKGEYLDVSGCGNSIAANNPITRKLIIESMKCWANELGIDGFRFDLGIALSRGEGLTPLEKPPLFEEIESDPELSDLKLISEPWDCGGLYRLDDFPANRVSTWNGHFRDDIRRFWKGDKCSTWPMKDRINGSNQLYKNNLTKYSINFITSHDGFTLKDLVSFNSKHNFANGECNRDGENHNNSWNHGIEGPSSDPELIELRNRQRRNLISTLLISPGVPMLLMGDEIGRSQGGNNNVWCQDNPLGWMNWDHEPIEKEFYEFIKKLLSYRKKFPELFSPSECFSNTKPSEKISEDRLLIKWHGIKIDQPDWSNWSHTISFSISKKNQEIIMWAGLNAYIKSMDFQLPFSQENWIEIINTGLGGYSYKKPQIISQDSISLINRSLAILINKKYFYGH